MTRKAGTVEFWSGASKTGELGNYTLVAAAGYNTDSLWNQSIDGRTCVGTYVSKGNCYDRVVGVSQRIKTIQAYVRWTDKTRTNDWPFSFTYGGDLGSATMSCTMKSGNSYTYQKAGAAAGATTANNNQWYCIGITSDGTNDKFYVDNVEVYSAASTQNGAAGENFYLGNYAYHTPQVPFSGYLSDIRIHTTVETSFPISDTATPVVTSLDVTSGVTYGGTAITITGSNFTSATGATIGGNPCTNFLALADDTITCHTPAGTAGAKDVVVTNTYGTGTKTNGFTYTVSVPTITTVTPSNTFVGNKVQVTLAGTNYYAGASVSFGAVAATNVVVNSLTEIVCMCPDQAAALVNVVVTNTDTGTATATNAFEYLAGPVPSSITPALGPMAGGTACSIAGAGFAAGAEVYFDATIATSIVVVSPSSITCVTPAHVKGHVNVTIINTDSGSGRLFAGFYYQAPTITQDTLEHDPTAELRVFLRRKRQNGGSFLFDNETLTTNFSSGTIDYNKLFYVVDNDTGTHEKLYSLNGDGTLNSTLSSGFNTHVKSCIATFGDCFYRVDSTAGSSAYFFPHNTSGGAAFAASGSGAGQLSAAEKIVIDGFQNMYVADTGNNRINLYRRGLEVAKITRTFTAVPTTQMTVDADGNIYSPQYYLSDLGLKKYNKDLTLLATFLPGQVVLSAWYDPAQDVIYALYQQSTTRLIAKLNKTSGVILQTIYSSTKAYEQIQGDDKYIYAINTTTYTVGKLVIDKNTGSPVSGVVGVPSTFTVPYMKIGPDGYMYSVNYNGTILTKSDRITGAIIWTAAAATGQTFLKLAIDREGFVYAADNTTTAKTYVFNKNGTYCYSWNRSGYDIAYNPVNDTVIIINSGTYGLSTWRQGLYTATFGASGTGDGQFSSSLHGLAVDSLGNVYTAEYGATARIQKLSVDQPTGAMTYVSQFAVTEGVSDVCFNTDDSIAMGIYNTKQIVIYLSDLSTYWSTFFVPKIITRMYARDGLMITGSGSSVYAYNINSQFGLMLGEAWRDITDYVDFTDSIEFAQTSQSSEFSLGEISYGSVTLKLANNNNFFDIEYMAGSIFNTPTFDFCRNDSLIKIMVNDKTLFIGAIDGKNCVPSDNFMSITAIHVMEKLKNVPTTTLGLTSGVSKISDAIVALMKNTAIVDFISFDVATLSIAAGRDYIIDDVSLLPEIGSDLMALLSRLSLFTYGVANGSEFFVFSVVDKVEAAGAGEIVPDYVITMNETFQIMDFNRGEQRIFGNIKFDAGSFTEKVVSMDPRINWIYNDQRIVSISSDAFSNSATRQSVVDDYKQYLNVFPGKEYSLTIPLVELLNSSFFKKIINVSIFNDLLANNFNTQSLTAVNTVFPGARTCIYSVRNQEYINYQVIGVTHSVGKKNSTTLILKELIKLN